MKAEKQNYLIGICNTDADGVVQYRVIGTKRQVQRHLVALVKEDRRNDTDGYNYGTEKLNILFQNTEHGLKQHWKIIITMCEIGVIIDGI